MAALLEARFPEVVEAQPELVAHHYTEAGRDEVAMAYWQRAGQRAVQRSAYAEAIAHLKQGLSLLMALPATPEHLQQELDFQVALGPALVATKGFAAPQVEALYRRAQELCQETGDTPQLFPVLRGLITHYQHSGQIPTAFQLGEEVLHLAQAQTDPVILILAHYQLGSVYGLRGEPSSARTHQMRALELYNPPAHRHLAVRYGIDLAVTAHSWLARALWQLGYPDQALGHSEAARALARELSHPFSLTLALLFSAILYQHRGEVAAVEEHAGAATTLASEQGFEQWLAWATVLHGWALSMQGQVEEGLAEMRQGLAAERSTGAKMMQPYFLGLIAEVQGEGGSADEGLSILSEAIAVMEATELGFYGSELYRLKGALRLRQEKPDVTEVETCFQMSQDLARAQQAKSWELRAAMSLAHLWQSQDKRQEAYDLLAPVYGWFSEGFDTADLKDAKVLLEELAG